MAIATLGAGQRQWFIVGRWQEYDGESRANLLRMGAVGAFYIVELLRFYVFERAAPEQLLLFATRRFPGSVDPAFPRDVW